MAEDTDGTLLGRIDALVCEEQQLYGHAQLSDHDQVRLERIKVELDRCWDLNERSRGAGSATSNHRLAASPDRKANQLESLELAVDEVDQARVETFPRVMRRLIPWQWS